MNYELRIITYLCTKYELKCLDLYPLEAAVAETATC